MCVGHTILLDTLHYVIIIIVYVWLLPDIKNEFIIVLCTGTRVHTVFAIRWDAPVLGHIGNVGISLFVVYDNIIELT